MKLLIRSGSSHSLPDGSSRYPQGLLPVLAQESFLEVAGDQAFVPYLLGGGEGGRGPLEKSLRGWMTWLVTWGCRPFLPYSGGQEEGPNPQRGLGND